LNVRTVCLAILFEGETTGYDIRKQSTEGEYAYFVEASYGSIYPALARLEKDGLVTSRVEQQKGRPARKVYSITEAGRRVFLDSLFEPLADDNYRCEFLLFARFASELPSPLVEKRIAERICAVEAHVAKLEELEERDLKTTERWILDYGLASLRQHRNYLIEHKDELVALAQPEAAQAAQ
jgi:PadR family transcriptional regulator AphA